MLMDDIRGALPTLRAAAESLMTSTFTITRATDETTTVDYRTVPVRETIYHGRGRLQTYEGYESQRSAGPATVVRQRMSLHLPVGSVRTRPGDLAVCVHSTDPNLIGRRYMLSQAYPVKDHATAYRVFVDELIEGGDHGGD